MARPRTRSDPRLAVQDPTKPLAVYAVFWHDAVKNDSLHEAHPPRPLLAVTVGFIVERNKDCVSIADEIFEDGDVRGVTTVPTGMVRRLQKIGMIRGVRV